MSEWTSLLFPFNADITEQHINLCNAPPGVLPERYLEAKTVKHCALSLVGEPIMYPRINEMVRHLHERGISTFLVGNGQFPAEIRDMQPVTQLYVSVDAATSESMKAVDRPLFKDFWDRFKVLSCCQYCTELHCILQNVVLTVNSLLFLPGDTKLHEAQATAHCVPHDSRQELEHGRS